MEQNSGLHEPSGKNLNMTRSTILTLAAVAVLGATALASTSASAMRSFGTFSHANVSGNAGGNGVKPMVHPMGLAVTHNPGANPGPAHLNPGVFNPGLGHINPPTNPGGPHPKFGFLKKPIDIDCVTFKPHCDHDHDHDFDHDHDHDHDWWWWKHHHAHWWYGSPSYAGPEYVAPVATGPVSAPVATAPVASAPSAPCNCLTKRYLADGSVLFTDLCTKEQAMATPDELHAQAQGTQAQNQ
jgi:hypothetical protein